ncbi:hypothetical protein [Edaphobacter albus]|uniref:hypothetical protein n=1 Tax=Edaphobacter sp. 4G125 TaxID=2763071 RepID=UPI001648A456|nr:hypothetical protein [Edaphobacter sp. 4G125]QNI37412.1 hypothetical protein H7846_03605 [Edaphobacter sp. 4G125]
MQKWLAVVGRTFYAVGLASIGLMHFFYKNFPGVVIPEFPSWLPLRLLWVFGIGAVLLACGVCILFNWAGRRVAAWTGVGLLVLVFVVHVPNQLASPYAAVLGAWANAIKELALAGGAWIAALSFGTEDSALPEWLERMLPVGRYFFAGLLVIFGSEHFLYAKFVESLIPAWIGSATFWTYFAGAALIAGGIGMMVKRVAKRASLLTGVMIFSWLLMLHIPRAIADPYTHVGNELASVFEALAFSGMAFMLAGQSRLANI